MFPKQWTRRALIGSGAALGLGAAPPAESSDAAVQAVSAWVPRYLDAYGWPGLSLAMVDKTGFEHAAGFGLAEVSTHRAVDAATLFEIGSISKSFIAIVLLQLLQEGKVDLQRPVLEYLPWLPIETPYGAITPHHLLTHTSGLPGDLQLFVSDPTYRHRQAYKPGEHFHYSNIGFQILGFLVSRLDGRPWFESVRTRVFAPLGMQSATAQITNHSREKKAKGYVRFRDDLPYQVSRRLTEGGNLVFENAAGSILASATDMCRYLQMLARQGRGPTGPILSESSFALFGKPWVQMGDDADSGAYGYGIMVDKLDGGPVLRHTGGMPAFASAMHVDVEAGVAAYASVNAQVGERPNRVTQFAVRALRARGRKMPSPPVIPQPGAVSRGADYVGEYRAADGSTLTVASSGATLSLRIGPDTMPVSWQDGDIVYTNHEKYRQFPFVFGRKPDGTAPRPVVEVEHGSSWYVNSRYDGPRSFGEVSGLAPFTGVYQNDGIWGQGSIRVYVRKGRLWVGGSRLEQLGPTVFRRGEAPSPDRLEFQIIVEGKAQVMKIGGDTWRRVNVA